MAAPLAHERVSYFAHLSVLHRILKQIFLTTLPYGTRHSTLLEWLAWAYLTKKQKSALAVTMLIVTAFNSRIVSCIGDRKKGLLNR
jgi:hypothetical protein